MGPMRQRCPRRRAGRILRALALSAALLGPGGRAARADGAFPDEMQVFVPADQPQRIVVSATFGLLVSEDDGQSWRWICETAVSPSLVFLYQVGPAPDHLLLGCAQQGLSISRDGGCSWQTAGGGLSGAYVPDAFPDPADPLHLLVVATPLSSGSSVPMGLYESRDGGQSFGGALYADPQLGLLTGVEIAASSPQTYYLTRYRSQAMQPSLLRSDDAGATWQTFDLGALGPVPVRLAAVDPTDAQTAYLRVVNPTSGDALAITSDGGQTVRTAIQLSEPMSAFLRRSDGALLVGTRDSGGFLSTDGGQTFAPWPGAPHLRALAERAGSLYAAGDNWKDNFAVGVSRDGGASWQPLLRFNGICGPALCPTIQASCADGWAVLERMFEIPADVCGQTPPDGGTNPPPPPDQGCAAATGPGSPGAPAALGLGAGLLLAALGLLGRGRVRRAASRRRARRCPDARRP